MRTETPYHPPRQFSLDILKSYQRLGVRMMELRIRDKYSSARHAIERTVFRRFVNMLEGYLRKRPDMAFSHSRNLARLFVYVPRSVKRWTRYMPGGFATHFVHNPEHERLLDGTRIGYITRNLFRHSVDAIGLRSRADAMAWFIKHHTAHKSELRWVSIACGTGQATYDSVRYIAKPTDMYLVDIDQTILDFAKEVSAEYKFDQSSVHVTRMDIKQSDTYESFLTSVRPQVVEAMGIVEYLDETECKSLVRRTLEHLSPGGVFVFTNMLPSHPHLHVHQRGVGWPGVIPRTTDEIITMLRDLEVEAKRITVMLPDDGVYAVYAITP